MLFAADAEASSANERSDKSSSAKTLKLGTDRARAQRYTQQLLDKIEAGEIDPSFIISHRRSLADAPEMYKTFRDKEDGCTKVVLTP